jgi:hypothetical protein
MFPAGGAEEGSMPERYEADPSPAEQGALIQQAGADLAYLHASHDVWLRIEPLPAAAESPSADRARRA